MATKKNASKKKAKVKAKIKSKSKKSDAIIAPSVQAINPAVRVLPITKKPGKKVPWKSRVFISVVAAVSLYAWLNKSGKSFDLESAAKAKAPAAKAAPMYLEPVKEWGKEIDLDVKSLFEFNIQTMDIRADKDGTVYILTGSDLRVFKDGKMLKKQALGGGSPWRAMAYDGKNFYITNFRDNLIVRLSKDFTSSENFVVEGASRLLGIAVSPKTGEIFAAEVGGKSVYVLSPNGKKKRTIDGPVAADGKAGFFADLQMDADGNIYQSNQYAALITKMTPRGKITAFPAQPWGRFPTYERMAIFGNKIYMNCYKIQRLVVMDTEGKALGHQEIKSPEMMGLGHDGKLYLKTGNEIEALKP